MSHHGPWSSVYTRLRRWCRSGLWKNILDLVSTDQTGELRHLDATYIKVHQDANSGGHHQTQAIGRTKGGLNTKISALADGQGRALQLAMAAGQRADVRAVAAIELPVAKRVVADKGYDSDNFRREIVASGATPCIPPKKNRVRPVAWHRGYYRKRHQVENFFPRLKRLRCVSTRYEKLSAHFLAFVQLAALHD